MIWNDPTSKSLLLTFSENNKKEHNIKSVIVCEYSLLALQYKQVMFWYFLQNNFKKYSGVTVHMTSQCSDLNLKESRHECANLVLSSERLPACEQGNYAQK